MLIILPPSETKALGGSGAPLDLARLALPGLAPIREHIVDATVALAADPDACAAALKLGPRQLDDVGRNAALWSSPSMPALERYTGVLFDALDAGSMTLSERGRAEERLMIGSALLGAVGATDPIPYYKLSAASRIPGEPTLRALWRPVLGEEIAALGRGLVVDLRSGGYAALGPVPGAISVTVMSERPDGSRAVVSHFNKHYKGLLARALAVAPREPEDARGVARLAGEHGMRAEVPGPHDVTLVV
ncbi:YaaA family protein [Lolliginicoccus suaedae]|uniref:YaaA family protein n=1 Tax=Lolliginicoccus suaedae TaxID=2605429 RepID=UPI0011EC2FBF|nr:peroxide stress protein YaaA [Lolliginicoccus suaedae]